MLALDEQPLSGLMSNHCQDGLSTATENERCGKVGLVEVDNGLFVRTPQVQSYAA